MLNMDMFTLFGIMGGMLGVIALLIAIFTAEEIYVEEDEETHD